MQRVIITGCNGLLGQKLVRCFKDEFTVCGVDLPDRPFISDVEFDYTSLDITDPKAVLAYCIEIQPAFILNAAAFTNVDAAEEQQDLCWQVNVVGMQNLIAAASETNAHLVHISTDYVFDGDSGPYRETDPVCPAGYYARTKLEGEKALLDSDISWTILRTMVVYGLGENLRPNFVTWLIDMLRAGKSVKIVTDQIGNVTLADDLARAVLLSVRKKAKGIFHVAGAGILSRFEFTRLVAEIFELNAELITPILTSDLRQKAPRPLNSGLIMDKAIAELGFVPRSARESLLEFKSQLNKTGQI